MAALPHHCPNVAIVRGTSADPDGNISMEHEGASLGALEVALAAQLRRRGDRAGQAHRAARLDPPAARRRAFDDGGLRRGRSRTGAGHTDGLRPGTFREERKPREAFTPVPFGPDKVIARRAALELARGDAVNLGFGISPLVPLILLEEGCDDAVTWAIEQGRSAAFRPRVRLRLRVQRPGDHSFAGAVHLFPGRRVRCVHAVVPRDRSRGVGQRVAPFGGRTSRRAAAASSTSPRTRSASCFPASSVPASSSPWRKAIFILKKGKVAKLVPEVEHVTFSGRRARAQGQQVTIVTERCVLKLESRGSWSPRSHPVWILSAMSCRRPRFRSWSRGI